MKVLRVLAVGAHPDDIEFLCAGTLARYARQGHEVVMGVVCSGDKGRVGTPAAEVIAIREREAHASAALIGARLLMLGLGDGEIHPERPEIKLLFLDLVRQARPHVVIAHHPADYNPDHVCSGELLKEASFYASVPGMESAYPALEWVPSIYFMDTVVGLEFSPQEYVDITDTLETKLAMMSAHQSQFAWLMAHDRIDALELIRTVARFRGLQCGVPFAEGFISYRAWGRPVPYRQLP